METAVSPTSHSAETAVTRPKEKIMAGQYRQTMAVINRQIKDASPRQQNVELKMKISYAQSLRSEMSALLAICDEAREWLECHAYDESDPGLMGLIDDLKGAFSQANGADD
jgi:hypothetical protein